MDSRDYQRLCLRLLQAESEDEVVRILRQFGYWDRPEAWRYYGDNEGNYSTIGNQQSRADAAIVEKVVNSVDAHLMGACQERGIPPDSPRAPRSISEAVKSFFNGRDMSRQITLAASGTRQRPCFTISDTGEGQTPNRMPETLLSLNKKNKDRIAFVQGRYNMGGTGVLEFCGIQNMQLIITKRNPKVVSAMNETDSSAVLWGFTIVRRENPAKGEKNSVYTYLAPVDCELRPRSGDVITFDAHQLPLMPVGNRAYARNIEWGTTTKLYEYDATGFHSNILMRDGLLSRLDLLMPDMAISVRLHECRDYSGHRGSFDTDVSGLLHRLENERQTNLELGFPSAVHFSIQGEGVLEDITGRIYAFKKNRAETYRNNEGVILGVNGQTHGYLPKTLFGRNAVKMGSIGESLLVYLDCSSLSARTREKLFMPSRDRLRKGEVQRSLEEELEQCIRGHEGLRALKDRRKQDEVAEKLAESKPLEEVLREIITRSPSLSALFSPGRRLSIPHKPQRVGANGQPPNLSIHPTYFRFEKLSYGDVLRRTCAINHRCRIIFETDAANDYLDRAENPGSSTLRIRVNGTESLGAQHSLNLHDGRATLNFKLPASVQAHEEMGVELQVTDPTLLEPFVNIAKIVITPSVPPSPGPTRPVKPPSGIPGDERDAPLGIDFPRIIKVRQTEWEQQEPKMDQFSACVPVQGESEADPDAQVYDFKVNVDNIYLRTEIKESDDPPAILEARFIYGSVLVGLAVIKDELTTMGKLPTSDTEEGEPVEVKVAQTTRAVAPFLLPMIKALGTLQESDVSRLAVTGDDE
jgi:hypothetical protein